MVERVSCQFVKIGSMFFIFKFDYHQMGGTDKL